MTLRIVLIDDNPEIRRELRTILGREQDLEVVGEARDGAVGMALVRELKPDVVVLDVLMSGVNGIQTAREITADGDGVPVLALSMHHQRPFVEAMVRAGASGYLRKERAAEELAAAIREVARGGTWFESA